MVTVFAEIGQFLQQQPFGLAVIAASTGMKGDSQKDKLLTEAQALVVQGYLVKSRIRRHSSEDDRSGKEQQHGRRKSRRDSHLPAGNQYDAIGS